MMRIETIEVNDWIDKFSEIKPHLDELLERRIFIIHVEIINDGCSNKIINRMVKYLNDHDITSIVESKGASALNRLYGGK